MTAQVSPNPVFQAFGTNGLPLAFGLLGTYVAGTATPQATWTDSTQATQNTNPVVLNALGQANVWTDPNKVYKFILQDAAGNQLYAIDNIQGAGAVTSLLSSFGVDSGSANSYVYTHAAASAAATLTAGVVIRFTPANSNTGSSTVNADGTGAVAVVGEQGSALTGGELSSLGPVVLQYTGTAWQIIATTGAQPPNNRTAAEIAAGVTPTNYAYPPLNVLRYGADPTGLADSTSAFNNAWASYKTIYAPTGTYLVDTISIPTTYYQRTLYGDGPGRTILNQKLANNDTILSTSTGSAEHTLVLKDFSLIGIGSGTGNGIHIPANSPNPPSNWKLQNLIINNYGGAGIYDQAGLFCSILENIQISGCAGNQFDLLGGNALTLIGCYAQSVPTAGKSGYRIHTSFPTLIGCTGINSGSWWGIFSDTVAEDGVVNFCQPTFIGCDCESFTTGAIRNKNSGINLLSTRIVCSNTNVMGCQIDGANNPGFVDRYESTFQLSSGSWLNGFPIHQISTGNPPFTTIARWTNNSTVTFWNDADAASHTMTGDAQTAVLTNEWAKTFQDLYVLGNLRTAAASSFGVFGVAPTTQQTGWGTPTGTGVIANFPGAAATLAQTSQAVATLIAYMKSLGFLGA